MPLFLSWLTAVWNTFRPFPSPAQELHFRKHRRQVAKQMFSAWCLLLIGIIFVMLTIQLPVVVASSPDGMLMIVCHALPIVVLVCFLLLAHYTALGARHLHILLLIAYMVAMCLIGWGVHFLATDHFVKASTISLVDIWPLVQDNEALRKQLECFVRDQVSHRSCWLGLALQCLLLDVFRISGCLQPKSIIFHFTPLAVFIATAFLSDILPDGLLDVFVIAGAMSLYAMLSTLHLLSLWRRGFATHHKLWEDVRGETTALQNANRMEMVQKGAAERAEEHLHHLLKKVIAEAMGSIELALVAPCTEVAKHLREGHDYLSRGMQWCRRRQAMLRLARGEYILSLIPTNLFNFGEELRRGRNMLIAFPNVIVSMDRALCDIVLDEAISKAFANGHPDDPQVCLSAALSPAKVDTEQWMTVAFTLTSITNPNFCSSINELAVGVGSESFDLDRGDCSPSQQAALAHEMALSWSQANSVVTFKASLDLRVMDCISPKATGELPAKLLQDAVVYCIDDSEVARQLMSHAIAMYASGATFKAFGQTQEDVDLFIQNTLLSADIAILDQHLDFDGTAVLGTDLVQHLLEAQFEGLICIWSAYAEEPHSAEYLRSGAHCVIGKDLRCSEVIALIQSAYKCHFKPNPLMKTASYDTSASGPQSTNSPIVTTMVVRPFSSVESISVSAKLRDQPSSHVLHLDPKYVSFNTADPLLPSVDLISPRQANFSFAVTENFSSVRQDHLSFAFGDGTANGPESQLNPLERIAHSFTFPTPRRLHGRMILPGATDNNEFDWAAERLSTFDDADDYQAPQSSNHPRNEFGTIMARQP